ncbi:MAG: hypothetical protein QM820_53125 [Minicystis sp.]
MASGRSSALSTARAYTRSSPGDRGVESPARGSIRCDAPRASPSASSPAAASSALDDDVLDAGVISISRAALATASAAAPGFAGAIASGRPFSSQASSSITLPSPFWATRTTTRSWPGLSTSTETMRITPRPPSSNPRRSARTPPASTTAADAEVSARWIVSGRGTLRSTTMARSPWIALAALTSIWH